MQCAVSVIAGGTSGFALDQRQMSKTVQFEHRTDGMGDPEWLCGFIKTISVITEGVHIFSGAGTEHGIKPSAFAAADCPAHDFRFGIGGFDGAAGINEKFPVFPAADAVFPAPVPVRAAAKNHGQIASEVKAVVTAGDDAYDLVLGQMEESGKNALEGYFRNWYDIPHVNFENPWYPKSLVQDGIASVNGKMYVAMSDLCISYAEQTWAIAYDKVEAENYGITGVYEAVREGKWTIDKLLEWTEDIYTDVNNDGIKDEGDFYGFMHSATGCHLAAYLYGFDQRTVDLKDGNPVMILNTEKTVSIFEKLYQLNQNPGTKDYAGSSLRVRDLFPAGRSVFATMQMHHCYNHMREFENPYGIIPFPKWDEAQEEYYSIVDAGCNIIAVLMTAQNTEMIGALVEALSAESWRSVMPTYCDITLSAKVARDEESSEMINMVLENRFIDFAYLYDGWSGWTFKLDGFLKKEGAFASTYAQQEKSAQTYYDKVIAFFYED